MAFQPGQSGNPSGRPKKLLKRVDEVLSERKIEPIAEVLRLLDALKRQRPTIKPPPASAKTTAERRTWQAAERARQRAEIRDEQLRIWLELLPYVYARPREAAAAEDPPDEAGKRRLAGLSDAQLLQLVKNQTG